MYGCSDIMQGRHPETGPRILNVTYIQVTSISQWARRCPGSEGEVIEIQQIREMWDYSEEVQAVADHVPDLKRQAENRPHTTPPALTARGLRPRPLVPPRGEARCA